MSCAGVGRTSSEAGSLPSGAASTPKFLSRIHVHTRCPFCVCINRLTPGVARMDVLLARPKRPRRRRLMASAHVLPPKDRKFPQRQWSSDGLSWTAFGPYLDRKDRCLCVGSASPETIEARTTSVSCVDAWRVRTLPIRTTCARSSAGRKRRRR